MKIGDIVYLKSGSPELTIISIDGENSGIATVEWKNGNIMMRSELAVAALTNVKPAERTMCGQPVILDISIEPGKIVMHPDTWISLEAMQSAGDICPCVKTETEASHV